MKRSRFSEEQIIGILREVQGGGNTRAVCAAHNIFPQIKSDEVGRAASQSSAAKAPTTLGSASMAGWR